MMSSLMQVGLLLQFCQKTKLFVQWVLLYNDNKTLVYIQECLSLMQLSEKVNLNQLVHLFVQEEVCHNLKDQVLFHTKLLDNQSDISE